MKKILLSIMIGFMAQNAHAQWTTLKTGTSDTFTSVFFPSEGNGFAVSADFSTGGKVMATTDDATWIEQASTSNYLFSTFFITDDIGWVGGGIVPDGIIRKTVDGGKNWITQPVVSSIKSLYFNDETTGWAIGNDGSQGKYYIYKTTDGGDTWELKQTGRDYVRFIHFSSKSVGWVAGDNGRILKTVDGGETWDLLDTGTNTHFSSVCFASDAIGWAVGSYKYGACYKTADGGLTWVPQDIGTLAYLHSIYFTSEETGWAVGDFGTIIKTVDGGTTWSIQTSNTREHLTSVHFPDANTGYAVGHNGTILKHSTLTGISKSEAKLRTSIFPNPSNGKFSITLDGRLLSSGNISLEIYSLRGEKVYAATNLRQQVPNEVDLSDSSSGMFVVKIYDGDTIHTEKIVIQ